MELVWLIEFSSISSSKTINPSRYLVPIKNSPPSKNNHIIVNTQNSPKEFLISPNLKMQTIRTNNCILMQPNT